MRRAVPRGALVMVDLQVGNPWLSPNQLVHGGSLWQPGAYVGALGRPSLDARTASGDQGTRLVLQIE